MQEKNSIARANKTKLQAVVNVKYYNICCRITKVSKFNNNGNTEVARKYLHSGFHLYI